MIVSTPISISVVIPAYNAEDHLRACLGAMVSLVEAPREIIVVDDGSTDTTRAVAESFGAIVISSGGRKGPALARNMGVEAAAGNVVLFIDADVCVRPETTAKIRVWFEQDAELDALIGSYDTEPGSRDFLSQYRNLMHSFVHQTGEQRASTFWSGCGAIRRSVFLEHSGFTEEFGRPAIEDIELGYRLVKARCKIVLDRTLEVKHLKKWTFSNLVKTDVMDRGIPWTELILRDNFMPDDLNLQLSQRISVALVFILLALSAFTAVLWQAYFLIPVFAIIMIMLARWWAEFSEPDRPWYGTALFFGGVGAIACFGYLHHMYGLIPPLLLTPCVLLLQHRYKTLGRKPALVRWLALLYVGASVVVSVYYLPRHGPVFIVFIILAILAVLNSQFYLFLAAKRGWPFMLAAIPFHLLYHFYNGISFLAGAVRHYTAKRE